MTGAAHLSSLSLKDVGLVPDMGAWPEDMDLWTTLSWVRDFACFGEKSCFDNALYAAQYRIVPRHAA